MNTNFSSVTINLADLFLRLTAPHESQHSKFPWSTPYDTNRQQRLTRPNIQLCTLFKGQNTPARLNYHWKQRWKFNYVEKKIVQKKRLLNWNKFYKIIGKSDNKWGFQPYLLWSLSTDKLNKSVTSLCWCFWQK